MDNNKKNLKSILAGVLVALAGFLLWFNLPDEGTRIKPEVRPLAEIKARMAEAPAEWVGVLGTGSMAPLIPAGAPEKVVAYVHIPPCSFDWLKQGDVVVFRHGRAGLVVHELAGSDSGGWITGGLNNRNYDTGRVTGFNFIGRVTEILLIAKPDIDGVPSASYPIHP
jgi:hypothetical protein